MRPRKKIDTSRRQRPQRQSSDSRQFVSYHASRQAREVNAPTERKSVAKAAVMANVNDPKRLPIILMFVLLAGCLLYTTTLTDSAKFVVTRPSGVPELRKASEYQQTADAILSSSMLNKNKITIDTAKIRSELMSNFPELDRVEVVLPLMGHRPIVEAVVSRPVLRVASQNGIYLVGSSGKALIEAKDIPAGTVIDTVLVSEEAQLNVKPGKAILAGSDVTFITTLAGQLKSKQLTISTLTLPPLASELRLQVEGEPFYVKFSLLADPRLSAGQYLAMRNYLQKQNIVPKEYIDARVEEKVYFK